MSATDRSITSQSLRYWTLVDTVEQELTQQIDHVILNILGTDRELNTLTSFYTSLSLRCILYRYCGLNESN